MKIILVARELSGLIEAWACMESAGACHTADASFHRRKYYGKD